MPNYRTSVVIVIPTPCLLQQQRQQQTDRQTDNSQDQLEQPTTDINQLLTTSCQLVQPARALATTSKQQLSALSKPACPKLTKTTTSVRHVQTTNQLTTVPAARQPTAVFALFVLYQAPAAPTTTNNNNNNQQLSRQPNRQLVVQQQQQIVIKTTLTLSALTCIYFCPDADSQTLRQPAVRNNNSTNSQQQRQPAAAAQLFAAAANNFVPYRPSSYNIIVPYRTYRTPVIVVPYRTVPTSSYLYRTVPTVVVNIIPSSSSSVIIVHRRRRTTVVVRSSSTPTRRRRRRPDADIVRRNRTVIPYIVQPTTQPSDNNIVIPSSSYNIVIIIVPVPYHQHRTRRRPTPTARRQPTSVDTVVDSPNRTRPSSDRRTGTVHP